MSFLNYHSCATCHGLGSQNLFAGLLNSTNELQNRENKTFFALKNRDFSQNYQKNITDSFCLFVDEIRQHFKGLENKNWGLILASTKGILEDQIWQESLGAHFDPYAVLLDEIKKVLPFSFIQQACVSNACASSHGAIELAQSWLKRQQVQQTLIVAVDLIGPFIYQGFSSLRALSEQNSCRPFDSKRDGLLLGDGLAIAVVGEKLDHTKLEIETVYNNCEGFSVTRPDTTGETLASCLSQSIAQKKPQAMIAHGTATFYNDLTEANAISLSFKDQLPPYITSTKWSVGHSLGASGLIDLNAAAEMILQEKIFAIHSLNESNLSISEYLVRENKNEKLDSVLISSLGFGGISSSFILKKMGS